MLHNINYIFSEAYRYFIYAISIISFHFFPFWSPFLATEGALTMFLNTTFWNLWIFTMTRWLEQSHNCVYHRSKLVSISIFRVGAYYCLRGISFTINQFILLYFKASSSLFFFICHFQRSFVYSVISRDVASVV